jgi:hypothetical protein
VVFVLHFWYHMTRYGIGYPSTGSVQLHTYNVFLPYGIKNVKKKKATTPLLNIAVIMVAWH